VHCASLGEFEQGRPVIERLKKEFATVKILLTFFSPSGYEIKKGYDRADYICYLPADSLANALTFIGLFKPVLSIFVKYEFWYHYLHILQKRNIPTLLLSAVFRENQLFFKWYGGLFKSLLFKFYHIFVQNQTSIKLLQSIGLKDVTLSGDTRVDRVVQMSQEAQTSPSVSAFVEDKNVLIIGSSWQADEAILSPFINQYLPADWKVILAPHDISENHLRQIEKKLSTSTVRYSKTSERNIFDAKVLLIDNIGMLAALYQYGKIAYIGGGFGAGIHNILEPIAFGLPVLFGPRFQKFEEAIQLTRQGGAFVIYNSVDFRRVFFSLQTDESYRKAATIASNYIRSNQGASDQIIQFIQKHRLLNFEPLNH